MNYPDTYLHITECRSGQTWVVSIGDNDPIDLEHNVRKWVESEYCGELVLDLPLMPKLSGDYYGRIVTNVEDLRESAVCLEGAGFYLRAIGGAK